MVAEKGAVDAEGIISPRDLLAMPMHASSSSLAWDHAADAAAQVQQSLAWPFPPTWPLSGCELSIPLVCLRCTRSHSSSLLAWDPGNGAAAQVHLAFGTLFS